MKIWTRPKKTTAKSNSNSSMASRMSSLVPNGTAWANYVISDTLVEKIPIRILICHGWNPYSCNWNSKNLSKTLIRSSINIDKPLWNRVKIRSSKFENLSSLSSAYNGRYRVKDECIISPDWVAEIEGGFEQSFSWLSMSLWNNAKSQGIIGRAIALPALPMAGPLILLAIREFKKRFRETFCKMFR